jgi:hypothetical protein
MDRRAAILTGVAAAAVLAGCGGSKFDGTEIYLFISAPIPYTGTNTFSVAMQDATGHCPLSPQATLAINGTTYPFGSCTGASDPFDGNPSFVLQAADGDDRAELTVTGMVPGADATIASPASGQVAAGGSITVTIPAALQGQVAQDAFFTNTSNVDGYAGMITYPTSTDSQTVDLPVPQHPATYLLSVQMASPPPSMQQIGATVVSCTGFAHCFPIALDVLGPLTVVVTP